MRKILLWVVLLSSAQAAQAAVSPIVTVTGKLVGISEQTVELQTSKGRVKVPRRAFKDQNSLKPNSMHQVRMPLHEFIYVTRTATR